MDEAEIFKHQGRRFLCSGEQLPSGSFQAVARCKMPPDDLVRTLVLGAEHYMTGRQALARAKELAEEWARTHPNDEQIRSAGRRPACGRARSRTNFDLKTLCLLCNS